MPTSPEGEDEDEERPERNGADDAAIPLQNLLGGPKGVAGTGSRRRVEEEGGEGEENQRTRLGRRGKT